jgi:hypothetical protein
VFRLAKILVCLFIAAAAHGQLTTSRVNVHVTGFGCNSLKDVFLVIDGNDSENQWIPLDEDKAAGRCHWTTNLGVSGSLSTRLSHFSLRLNIARTDCRQAAANEEQLAAELEFSCCSNSPLRNVQVKTDPPMSVSYLRRVPKSPDNRTGGIPCVEVGTFSAGAGLIRQTQFSGEDVYLQLGALKPKPPVLGILLNDIVVDNGVRVLTRDGVVYRLSVQRAKGTMGSSPTFSSNAIALDIKKLGDLKFERAEFQVIK